ncbi:nicotinamidase [Sporobolomyces salmoneus]|uniref:nicotinamidase n=1 Tax=Sporobolomyces salmoneus TaxID=183962 RepID=UPI003170FD75
MLSRSTHAHILSILSSSLLPFYFAHIGFSPFRPRIPSFSIYVSDHNPSHTQHAFRLSMNTLLLIDCQNDFLPPNGSLAVSEGDLIIPHVLRLLSLPFDLVDFHPANHVSFASAHPSSKAFESIRISHPVTRLEKDQELWPDHCVQGTSGVQFEARVAKELQSWIEKGKGKVVKKGQDVDLDAYSAFAKPLELLRREEEERTEVELESPLTHILKQANTKRIFVAGLATDFCVKASVLSALEESAKLPEAQQWEVYVVREAVRGVYAEREEETLKELEERGAHIVSIDGAELESLQRMI